MVWPTYESSMKAFVALIVIAALAAGGYFWLAKRHVASDTPTDIPGPSGGIPGPTPGQPGVPTIPGAQHADPPGPTVPAAVKADYDKAEALWKSTTGDVPTSAAAPQLARLYSTVLKGLYNQPGAKALEDQLLQSRLTPLGTALFFTKARYDDPLFFNYAVASGDVPDKLAKQYGMSYQQINLLRGRDPENSNLRLGETLKLIRMKDNGGSLLHADKSDFCVDAYVCGIFARRYDISIGAPESPTPIGVTKAVDLVFNPTWKNPKTGEVYQPGDPRNILGGVWIALSPDGINETGIGLHGYTGEDQTLRRQASNGCLRLGNEAIKELAHLIAHPNRSPTVVEIVE